MAPRSSLPSFTAVFFLFSRLSWWLAVYELPPNPKRGRREEKRVFCLLKVTALHTFIQSRQAPSWHQSANEEGFKSGSRRKPFKSQPDIWSAFIAD